MVTSRQVGRGIARTVRAMERNARAAERRRAAYAKAADKAAQLQAAAEAVDEYEAIIAQLVGAHRISYRRRDWHSLATTSLMAQPVRGNAAEAAARRALDSYEPNWLARTFRLAARQRARLEAAVSRGHSEDERLFRAATDAAPGALEPIDFNLDITSPEYAALWPWGEAWCQELEVFHNPLAEYPISFDVLPGATHWFEFESEVQCRTIWQNSVLASITQLISDR